MAKSSSFDNNIHSSSNNKKSLKLTLSKKKENVKGHIGQRGPVQGLQQTEMTTITIGTWTRTSQFVHLPLEVVGLIIGNLQKEDLLSCRQVNKSWWALTNNNILQERPLHFQFSLDGETFRDTFKDKFDEINYFTTCLKNAEKVFQTLDTFPCVKRVTLTNLNLDGKNVQNFFDLYGPHIVSLELYNFVVQINEHDQLLQSLNRLLTQQAPTIKFLTLSNPMIEPRGISAFLFDDNYENVKTGLPHLQQLQQGFFNWRQEENILEEIVTSAPNLKAYNIIDGYVGRNPLNKLDTMNKLKIVKNLVMSIHSRNIDIWQLFAKGEPKLESWTIQLDYDDRNDNGFLQQTAEVINQILESSKTTLTTFDPFHTLSHVSGLVFPVLGQVKKLKLTNQIFIRRTPEFLRHQYPKIFPAGLVLATTFPNVDKVNMYGVRPGSVSPHVLLGGDPNCWPSVQTLKINFRFQKHIHNLSWLCPNLKNLVVDADRANFTSICRKIFEHMRRLESLKFFNVDCSLPSNRFPALDSALTGFCHVICGTLAASQEFMLDEENVQKQRGHVSVLELTRLKNLEIAVDRSPGPFILSRASGIYAFRLMPRCRVTVTIARSSWSRAENMNRQTALDCIAPFVHSTG